MFRILCTTARRFRAAALTALVATLALAAAHGARAAGPYLSPFSGERYLTGRTDMGVDFCLDPGEAIRAVGSGVITGVMRDWFERQPYVWYELTSGPDAGRYVYVAEQIHVLVRPGQAVKPGQPIARYLRKGTCIETGWSAADGETLAAATTGYREGQVTRAGVSFARFLISLGVQGSFELVPTPPRRPGKPHKHPGG